MPRDDGRHYTKLLITQEDGFFDVVWKASCHKEQDMAVVVWDEVPVVVSSSFVVQSVMHRFSKYDGLVFVLLVCRPRGPVRHAPVQQVRSGSCSTSSCAGLLVYKLEDSVLLVNKLKVHFNSAQASNCHVVQATCCRRGTASSMR